MKEQLREAAAVSAVPCQQHVGSFVAGCATTVLVTGAGIGEMVLQLLVGSVSVDEACPKRPELLRTNLGPRKKAPP